MDKFFKTLLTAPENKNNVSMLVEYGSWLFANKRYDEAMQVLDRAITNEPSHCAAHYLKGFVYLQQKNISEAHKYLSTAARLEPYNVYARVNLGQFLI